VICYPFHSLPWAISWDFSLPARCDLLSISFLALGYFIGFFITCQVQFVIHFIPCPGLFHRIFHYLPGAICYPSHSLPWAISWDFSLPARCDLLSISFLALGYFIGFFITCQVQFVIHFIPCPGLFHRIFHYLPGAICYPFHSLPWAISWDFSLPARCNLWSISFLALGYFIPSSLHFSLLARCNFLSISIPALGHFIPCMGPLHTNPVGFFITCQVWFFIHFIPCPGPSHTHTVTFFIASPVQFLIHFILCPWWSLFPMASPLFSGSKSALSNMEMHAFPPLHIPPKGNHSWFDQKVKKNKIMMILPIRIHPRGCQDDGHMTNYQKW